MEVGFGLVNENQCRLRPRDMRRELGDDLEDSLVTTAQSAEKLPEFVIIAIGVELDQSDTLKRWVAKERFQDLQQVLQAVGLTDAL